MKDNIIKLTRRHVGKLLHLRSGKKHDLGVKTSYQGHMLEVEDAHFHHDSAVLLPDYGVMTPEDDAAADQNRVTGLAVLYACYRHAREHPQQRMLVVGHADRSGSKGYNQTLSELRARNVENALRGDRTGWAQVAHEKNKVEDRQQILRWLTHAVGWDCDPGPVDGVAGSQTVGAVRDFQQQYNERLDGSITTDGVLGPQTWAAIFDVYMEELQRLMGTDEEGLAEARQHVHFMDCPSIGCGEGYPITSDRQSNYRSAQDRRVEVLFFDPEEVPLVDCSAPSGACTELYEKKMYSFQPVTCDPLPLPSGVVPVYAQIKYEDPEGQERCFPEGLPIRIDYSDGVTKDAELKEDGLLDFRARKVDFTMSFPLAEAKYVAVPSPDSNAPPELIAQAHVQDRHQRGFRIFKLPEERSPSTAWSLRTSDWTAIGVSDYQDGQFTNMASAKKVGSKAAPARLVLDPHWQYARFEFFDRRYGHSHHGHERISIPPVLLQGYVADTLVTHSNWMYKADDAAAACQCLPWIIQRAADGSDRSQPGSDVRLQFQTRQNAFVISDDESTRRIEVVNDAATLAPGPERLKYYDLPAMWKSSHYYTRIGDSGDFFENLTAQQIKESTQYDKRLVFSLDDLVLTDDQLRPVALGADDRVAVFFHQFQEPDPAIPGLDVSPEGIYKAGDDATKPYYPYSDVISPVRHYVWDYPDWTRAVVAQGNVFDAFDQRTPVSGDVVGARAAVRWVDAVAAGVPPGSRQNNRPGRTDKPFFSVQPYFAIEDHPVRGRDMAAGVYREWQNPVRAFAGWLYGRFDMVLLRCCDIDGEDEVAVNVQKFRFRHDFSATPGVDQSDFLKKALTNIPKRWNGPDQAVIGGSNVVMNPGNVAILPQDSDANKLKVRTFWIAQEVPQNRAHFKIDLQPNGRAFMGSSDGSGGATPGDEAPQANGWFTAAHECGHADSLPDEYNERWSNRACSYQFPGLGCNVPGDPYSLVSGPMMMEGCRDIHSRYFWHAAEWVRLTTGIPTQVEVTDAGKTYRYKVRQHPNAPKRTFVYFPLIMEANANPGGGRAQFDQYLYQLGDDKYRYLIESGKDFDGLLVVVVKLRVVFADATAHSHIVDSLNAIRAAVDGRFNRTFQVDGGDPIGDVEFEKCLVHFSPRFLVETLIVDGTADNNSYLRGLGYNPPGSATQANYLTHVNNIEGDHPRHFMVNIDQSETTGWAPAGGANGRTLDMGVDVTTPAGRATVGSDFWPYFGDMVGLNLHGGGAGATAPTNAGVQSTIVRRLMPSGTVSSV